MPRLTGFFAVCGKKIQLIIGGKRKLNISEFASQYRLKLTRDECGDLVIAGRVGLSTIYEHSDGLFGVMFITDAARTGLWNKFQSACLAAGMTPCQVGDAEGSFTF